MNGRELRELRREFGFTQRDVAAASGIHQPDVSEIERGRSATPEQLRKLHQGISSLIRPSQVLARRRDRIREVLEQAGARNIRVFGSAVRGTDRPGSDLDLLVDLPERTGLLRLAEMTAAAEDVANVRVDLVPDDDWTATSLRQAKAEAVPL